MSDKEKLELEDLDWLEDMSAEAPIFAREHKQASKHNQSKKIKYDGKGWKYFLSIKAKLPEWWDEFNSKTKDTGPYYRNIWSFIKTKTKNSQERTWLYQMFGPKPEEDEKLDVPWLANWEKRRKNGYWNTEDGYDYRRVAKIINNNLEQNKAIKAAAPFLVQEMIRYTKLQERVDEIFNGKPFNENKGALSPVNKTRFNRYLEMMERITNIKKMLWREWMRINGVNPNNPGEMRDMATVAMMSGQVGAAAALTGAVAGNGLLNTGPQDNQITRDAVLLALQLKQHEVNWKKNLPSVSDDKIIDSIPIEKDRHEKPNGKHKTQ